MSDQEKLLMRAVEALESIAESLKAIDRQIEERTAKTEHNRKAFRVWTIANRF